MVAVLTQHEALEEEIYPAHHDHLWDHHDHLGFHTSHHTIHSSWVRQGIRGSRRRVTLL